MDDQTHSEEKGNKSFWNTTMGAITKITALLAATTGLIVAIQPLIKSKQSENNQVVHPPNTNQTTPNNSSMNNPNTNNSAQNITTEKKKLNVGLQGEKNNRVIFADATKSDFLIEWRNLTLSYDESNLDYDIEMDLSFAGCSSCLTQILIWIDADHNACIYDGNASVKNVNRSGHIRIPKSLANHGSLDIRFVAFLENNCLDAQNKRKTNQYGIMDKIIGSIPASN